MDDAVFHRFSTFIDLTDQERHAMRDMAGHHSVFNVAEYIRIEGDHVDCLYFLLEGWVLSSVAHPQGGRQVLKVHRSGDILGAPSLPFEAAVESLVALTAAKVSAVPLQKLGALFVAHPRVAAILFLASQEERVTLMDRLAVGGQLGARHNLGTLLLQLFDGRPPSQDCEDKIHIPLTQEQIGEVLGLSSVHVNRMMKALEDEGLVKRDGRSYELPDLPRLRSFVGMVKRVRKRNPVWLPPRELPS